MFLIHSASHGDVRWNGSSLLALGHRASHESTTGAISRICKPGPEKKAMPTVRWHATVSAYVVARTWYGQ